MVLYMLSMLPLRLVKAPIIAIAIKLAISAYSIAVAPRSLRHSAVMTLSGLIEGPGVWVMA